MSTRRPLIAGNWKMNLNPVESVELVGALRTGLDTTPPDADVVVAPTFLSLPAVAERLAGSPIMVAGQNMHAAESGAYTGEISGPMLRSAGAGWVILDTRSVASFFGETDAGVALKAKAALAAGLLPILCLGETLEEREAERTLTVVQTQLEGMLRGLTELELDLVTLAYEPVWAIGTGLTASGEQAQEVHAHIRGRLAEAHGRDKAEAIRILYGGSVKPDNVVSLMARPDVDGALVGGASLTADSFLALIPPYPPA